MPPRRTLEYWQSFSDIAMAFMGTLILVLVVLLHKQRAITVEHADEAKRLSDFAARLLDELVRADQVVARQDRVGVWLRHVFRETEGCGLEFNPETNKLEPRGGSATELYKPGEVELSSSALLDLSRCRDAFRLIAACMSPVGSIAARECGYASDRAWTQQVDAFRDDIDALVITGNTDRVTYGDAERIHGAGRALRDEAKSFVGNAQLGSERSRQALGHLLILLQPDDPAGDRTPDSVLQVFMNRASIESPAFGPFQAGPLERRVLNTCNDTEACPEARSLAMRLRWKTTSLRDPFSGVKKVFCDRWDAERQQLEESLGPERAKRAHELCEKQP
jgi:hypothetical protein